MDGIIAMGRRRPHLKCQLEPQKTVGLLTATSGFHLPASLHWDDAARAVCFATGSFEGPAPMATRFAGSPAPCFALRATFPPGFLGGLARPEALTFLELLALAFADEFLPGWESFLAVAMLPSLGAILATVTLRMVDKDEILASAH